MERDSGTTAFTLIELLVMIVILTLVASVLLPAMSHARQRARRIRCTSNLKQIGMCFKTWALDHKDLFPSQALTNNAGVLEPEFATNASAHFLVISNELATPRILLCPADAARAFVTDFRKLANTNTSYFISLDAEDSRPNMLLAGDRNLTNGLPVTNGVLYLATNRPVGWTHELHCLQGNAGLADGSVQQFAMPFLMRAVANAGVENRLLMP